MYLCSHILSPLILAPIIHSLTYPRILSVCSQKGLKVVAIRPVKDATGTQERKVCVQLYILQQILGSFLCAAREDSRWRLPGLSKLSPAPRSVKSVSVQVSLARGGVGAGRGAVIAQGLGAAPGP